MSIRKDEERRCLDRLAAAIDEPWLNHALNHERPDFIFPAGMGTLGIEVAEVFFDRRTKTPGKKATSDAADVAGTRNAFLGLFDDELSRRHPREPLLVSVDLSATRTGERGNVIRGVATAADAVDRWVQEGTESEVAWNSHASSGLAAIVSRIKVHRIDGLDEPAVVAAGGGGWARSALSDEVAVLIEEKEAKRRSTYSKCCASVWLLLVAKGSDASILAPGEFDPTGMPPHGFARTYLLDDFRGRVILLSAIPSSGVARAVGTEWWPKRPIQTECAAVAGGLG